MRIVDATVDLVELPAQPVFRWRDGLPGSEPPVTGGVLRLRTDDGLIGEAHTRRGVIVADLVNRVIRDEIVGADPLSREYLWQRMWELDRREEFPIYALGLVDIALWDIAGKAAGLPVHRLAGGFREAIPAYASTVTYGSVEEYLDVVDQCLDLGYQAVKVHAWGDARRDGDLVARLRAHVGDDLPLMYDGSAAFNLGDAVHVGRALADAGFLWYEEPMREFNVTAHRWLAENIGVPLLVGETADGAHMNTADFIASGSATYVRTSPHLKGGFTGAIRIAHLAEAYLMNAEVHGSGLLQRQLCMAVPNTTYYESQIMGNPIIPDAAVGADGMVRAPSAPGIGYDANVAAGRHSDTTLSPA
ncbi:enolase C-terminal domain-like protein [Jiangella asiatica]|uniref:Racemase n=1 Tax=Jiangella asiatica TaxID=2530372 RepID=A0A4R5DBS6_9ACTN|nr:enolase C-terminal domain-like protein [Jiangella asiatica]TDE11156.1 racemase [Jiangella asiatica]